MSLSPSVARTVRGVLPTATVKEAMDQMKGLAEACLVVVDADNVPIGILTGRDVALKVVGTGRRASSVRIEEIMTRPVFTVPIDASIEEVTRSLKTYAVRRLPMVGLDGRLEGIVTAGDLFVVLWGDMNSFGTNLISDP